jgi:hypothetical protein
VKPDGLEFHRCFPGSVRQAFWSGHLACTTAVQAESLTKIERIAKKGVSPENRFAFRVERSNLHKLPLQSKL